MSDILKVTDSRVIIPPQHAANATKKKQIRLSRMLPEHRQHQLLSPAHVTTRDGLLSGLAELQNGRGLHVTPSRFYSDRATSVAKRGPVASRLPF